MSVSVLRIENQIQESNIDKRVNRDGQFATHNISTGVRKRSIGGHKSEHIIQVSLGS